MHVAQLADTVDAPKALLQPRGVPRQVVVDKQMAELQVDAFARGLGGNADLAAGAEILLRLLALVGVHPAVYFASGVAPAIQMLAQMRERVAMLGEHQQLAATVLKLLELRLLQAVAQCNQLGVLAARAHAGDSMDEIGQCSDLRT